MAIDRRFNKIPPKSADPKQASGMVINPGPYEAVVKGVLDTTRSGRLQVWIPELGAGDQDNVQNWYTVGYASPFMGATNLPNTLKNGQNNTFNEVRHTYGFWAVPPDIGNIVLVTFINGDPSRGYWFACVMDKIGFGMVPGIGGGDVSSMDTALIKNETLKKALTPNSYWPLSEFNENNEANKKEVLTDFNQIKKPPHEYAALRYIKQGLDRDPDRGAKSTSAQKNIPSAVFGISTPGRPFERDTADIANLIDKVNSGDFTDEELEVIARKGGHSIVMDDGDFYGKNQFVRFRTSAGHQILMDDYNRNMYVVNSEGSAWIELAGSGHLHIFSSGGFNLRSKGDINLHSDQNVNINAEKSVNIVGDNSVNINSSIINTKSTDRTTIYGGSIGVGSDGAINFSASGALSLRASGEIRVHGRKLYLQSGAGFDVKSPVAVPKNSHSDTGFNSGNSLWETRQNASSSIVSVLPTHEPWNREFGVNQFYRSGGSGANGLSGGNTNDGLAPEGDVSFVSDCVPPNVVRDSSGTPVKDGFGEYVTSGVAQYDPGIMMALQKRLPSSKAVNRSYMDRNDNTEPMGSIGSLNTFNVKALFTALAYSESGFNYKAINPYNYVGKYQMGAAALATLGYIRMDYYKQYGNASVKQSNAWTGKGGINSLSEWFSSPGVQEKVMYENTLSNYKTMVNNGAIKNGDNLCTIAGMLCVAHLLGPNTGTDSHPGAKGWRMSGNGSDANGSTGAQYFLLGKYSIDVLAKSVNGV